MQEVVQKYYGETLSGTQDLQTDACCTTSGLPDYVKALIGHVHDTVLARYYGCGLIFPQLLDGLTMLDLGCGAGRDVYVLAQMVGEQGKVIGVDMTSEQLAVAREYEAYHQQAFGYAQSNVEFLQGDIERLDELGLADNSIDVIVSNCVINLVTDKARVLREAFRVLKPGGELYFSDVYSDRRIPAELTHDPVLYGECLSGALYWNDFLQLSKQCGFTDPRLVEDSPININNAELAERVCDIHFYSATYRLFKLDALESSGEDYGQSAVYKGTIPHHPKTFVLDKQHVMETGKPFRLSGNSVRMLQQTRFASHFEFQGNFDQHRGLFSDHGSDMPFDVAQPKKKSGCC